MTRHELLELLAVERHTPGPRPPRTGRCDPPAPVTPEQAEANRALLLAALDGDRTVIDFYERKASA